MEPGFRVHAERTPNPDSIKWVLGRPIVAPGVAVHFDAAPAASVSPLAARLFEIDGIVGVFLASNFVTVTRRTDVEWTDLAQPVVERLRASFAEGVDALGPAFEPGQTHDEDVLVARIREVLDEEVRPALAMDGGDVEFVAFRDGIVVVSMRGACSGCPSSVATLEHGIGARLRECIPEVRGVVAA
ncbi:MAG: NifU family protein [Deltaproteobacteria bacterium]|nr:NifU family protein [Deltaproteobacteria bacterium]MBW2360892.1 NifU family protein [Deltaproteobacteria bacterium]